MEYRTLTALIAAMLAALPLAAQKQQSAMDVLRQENARLRRELAALRAKGGEYDPWSHISGLEEYDDGGFTSIESGTPVSPSSARTRFPHLMDASPAFTMKWDAVIDDAVDRYTGLHRKMIQNALGRYAYWFPLFRDTFRRYGVPEEVTALCIVESAVTPTAISSAGAAGMWQLMPETARRYGLTVGDTVDERFDCAKSTAAAARYLSDLHRMFGSWPLAVMAYNCGEGNIRKAIIQNGSSDVWTVWGSVPKETQLYLPSFLAASYLSAYGQSLEGLQQPGYTQPACRTVRATHEIDIMTACALLGLDGSRLRKLNPQYIRGIVPEGYPISLPESNVKAFTEALEDGRI